MNRVFEVYKSKDKIALRRALFAIELLDAVTLERVSKGVMVKAHGLQRKPITNQSGLFVWLDEDIEQLQKISIDPGVLPYEETERIRAQLNLEHDSLQGKWPLTTIELPPRVDYPFGVGITGLRGRLVEELGGSQPVQDATVYLRWLDQNGDWQDAPTRSHTTVKGGDFVAILRLAPKEEPQLDATGNLTVRLCVKRGEDERRSNEQQVLQGQVTNPSTQDKFVFAWDDMER